MAVRKAGELVVVLAAVVLISGAAAASSKNPFPMPPGLKPQVEFWKNIFTIYSTNHVVIHDRDVLGRVYSVLDFSYLADGFSPGTAERVRKERVREEIERVRALLSRLQQAGGDSAALTEGERRIADVFPRGTDARVFGEAALEDRVRAQSGLSDKFHEAIEVAHGYWPEMERIFREQGLPVELTRLPLVESSFNLKAYSRTGAAGIWQFMPATGRLYMRIDDAVDERRDPLAATRAAAKHLKENYEILGTWPLAITAYNHGRGGMARAVSQLGTTDIVQIIKNYKGRVFGFASKNFYAEFLAAVDVARNASRYYKGLRPHAPRHWHSATLPHYVRLSSLARTLGTSTDTLSELNPALSGRVISGDLYVPRGYEIRLPVKVAGRFETAYANLSDAEKHREQRRTYVVHRVRRGETLATIARRYGTTVKAIVRKNRLRSANQIRIGQALRISHRAGGDQKVSSLSVVRAAA
jgi:membrane-bound lytic murein transglycosylase D